MCCSFRSCLYPWERIASSVFPVRIGAVPFVLIAVLFSGCRSLENTRIFREQVRRHGGQVVWVRDAMPLMGEDLSPELRLIGGAIRGVAGGSERRLRWGLGADTAEVGPVEAASRAARERGLWITQSVGDMTRLKAFLESGVPAIVWLAQGDFFPARQEPCLVVGYDEADVRFFCMDTDGAARLVPYAELERAWSKAAHRWILVLPADFEAVPLLPSERFARGLFREARGELERALADYEAAVTANPPISAALVRKGNILMRLGRIDEAEAAYRAAIHAAPESAQAYNNLALLLAETEGRSGEAVALARNALMLDPANPRVLDTLGYALYKSGKTREAADVLERARGRARWLSATTQAEIAVHLVRAHLANGDVHLAREVLRDALRLAPETVPQELRELLK